MRVVRPWPRSPREAVAAPSLAGFKARLDRAGSTLGWWKGSLPVAGGWNRMVYTVPSQPEPFCEPLITPYPCHIPTCTVRPSGVQSKASRALVAAVSCAAKEARVTCG